MQPGTLGSPVEALQSGSAGGRGRAALLFAFSSVLLWPNRIRTAALGLCGALVEF
jgi:hypothetical protein